MNRRALIAGVALALTAAVSLAFAQTLPSVDNRKPGEANPFDVGAAAVGRYFTLVEECSTAAKLRAAGKP